MIADTAKIRSQLEELQDLPTPVCSWIVEEGIDWMDNPAVWVWALLDYDAADEDALFRLRDMVFDVVQDTCGLLAYVRIRDANETEAAA